VRSDLRDERGRDGISGWSSTGKGRTTCGYFLKDNKTVIYAEHARPRRGVPRPAGNRSKGMCGPCFPGYGHLLGADERSELKKLRQPTATTRRRR